MRGRIRSPRARKFGFSKQRYFQLRNAFKSHGSQALLSQKRGPKTPSKRTDQAVRQVIRHRFRSRRLRRCHRPKNFAKPVSPLAPQRRTHHCRLRPAKKNSISSDLDIPIPTIDTHATKNLRRPRPCDPAAIEAGVRQTLADRLSGNLVGLWLLVPEHLRLGTWDLLCGWTGRPGVCVEPRLALQLVHEAALCLTGIRTTDAVCGNAASSWPMDSPFSPPMSPSICSSTAIRSLTPLSCKSPSASFCSRASNHFQRRVLVIDPHRLRSYSKRQMRRHKE